MIFVQGRPFTARSSAKLNEPDLVPGITGHTVQVLETSLKESLQGQLKQHEHRFEYWHEPSLLCNELAAEVVDPTQVRNQLKLCFKKTRYE